DDLRRGLHQRGLQAADRGRHPRAPRHHALPAGLAGDARAGDHGAGPPHRRRPRHGCAQLPGQRLHAPRRRARQPPGGRRRDLRRGPAGREAAVKAMSELTGPVIGITLVLMSVFLPAAFMPGLTGQMYQQFALVIAATALISAINAMTLKPTQCALWLRPPTPPEKRNFIYRGFNRVYDACERWYAGLIHHMVKASYVMVVVALGLIGLAFWGMSRVPTAFIPLEDQGYMMVNVQLPDGSSLERTDQVLDDVQKVVSQVPGVDQVFTISGISILDNNASLPSAGAVYVVLKDWSVREADPAQGLLGLYQALTHALEENILDARTMVIPPPPIQGIGNAGGFSFVVQLRDGSGDLGKLQNATDDVTAKAVSQSAVSSAFTSFRATVPQFHIGVNRTKAETLGVTV